MLNYKKEQDEKVDYFYTALSSYCRGMSPQIYGNEDILFYSIFIFLIIVLLVLKISKYKRDHKVVKVIKYILAIPIIILNILIFDDLNISLQLFKDEDKTDNKK